MLVKRLHGWKLTVREAIQLQKELCPQVVARGRVGRPGLVAGADVAYSTRRQVMVGCVVVLSWPEMDVVEEVAVTNNVPFPYVPGLLSFREAPVLLRAFRRLRHEPDVVFIDGHGLSHPRRFGVACHLGLCLDRPVIGCAKSRLTGAYREPALSRSSESALTDAKGEVIGAVLRSRARVKPIFVSVGHRIGLREAVRLTLACTKGFRIPEPTRQADLLAERAKREEDGV